MTPTVLFCSYDGIQFIEQLEEGVKDRLDRRGKPPRVVRYLFYCGWARSLLVSIGAQDESRRMFFNTKEVGPPDAEYAFPAEVLRLIRTIAPGDIRRNKRGKYQHLVM